MRYSAMGSRSPFRLGFWVVLLAIVTLFFYWLHLYRQELIRIEAKKRLYQSYGEHFLGQLGEGNLSGCQSCFDDNGVSVITLEDIALFTDSFHLRHSRLIRWKDFKEEDGDVHLLGVLGVDENKTYPFYMIFNKQEGRVLIRSFRVGKKILQPHQESFPFIIANSFKEDNKSDNLSGQK